MKMLHAKRDLVRNRQTGRPREENRFIVEDFPKRPEGHQFCYEKPVASVIQAVPMELEQIKMINPNQNFAFFSKLFGCSWVESVAVFIHFPRLKYFDGHTTAAPSTDPDGAECSGGEH
jgi:hypothetical protein